MIKSIICLKASDPLNQRTSVNVMMDGGVKHIAVIVEKFILQIDDPVFKQCVELAEAGVVGNQYVIVFSGEQNGVAIGEKEDV